MHDQYSQASTASIPPGKIPTGTITFLFTDIEGSTQLWEKFPEQMAAELRRHNTLLRQAIEAHGGYVFKTVGDQFCAAFANAYDALSAAIEVQRALINEPWDGPDIKVRIGIHCGPAEEWAGDYFGPTVNRVARLMAIGHGGQTLLSASVLQLVDDEIPSEIAVQDLGEHRLKNLRQPERVYQVNIHGLADDFPPLNSLSVIANNLPLQVTEFIGREEELAETRRILNESRLLTIAGPGGIGKSRLSLELAANLAEQFEQGVFFVPLAPVAAADLVPEAIAESIGFSLASAEPPEKQLLSYLADKNELLVLDNMEHIVDTAEFVNQILRAAPGVKIIVTSRERLRLSGESTFMLHGLGSDGWDSLASAHEDEAVQLFVDTARRVRPDFEIAEDDLDALREIIAMIQGSPLGIVLAASWIDMLSLQEIAAEIGRSFDFLDSELRDVPERQRSARAVFDYSWRLLSQEERELFTALSVFRGGFTREAAQDVAGTSIRELVRLANKSFVAADTDSGRYTVHELLRQYGEAALQADPERYQVVRDNHARYFASLVDAEKEAIYRGDHSKILADLDNIRAAWRWAVVRRLLEDLRVMMWPLGWFYDLRAYYVESVTMFRLIVDALKMPEPEGLQGIVYGSALANYAIELEKLEGADRVVPLVREGFDIMRRLGAKEDLAWPQLVAGWTFQDPQEIESAFLESLAIFEERDNLYGIAFSLLMLSWYYRNQGRHEEARSSIERGVQISRSLSDPEGQAVALLRLGNLNLHLGHYETARRNFQEERELWRELALPRLVGQANMNMGEAYLLGGDTARAEGAFLLSLEDFAQISDEAHSFWSLLGLARIALRKGQAETAQELLNRAGAVLEGRQDSYEQARWWQLFGRLSLLQNEPADAQKALSRALAYSQQADNMELLRTIVEFAYLYQAQSDTRRAARLLGFVQSQAGLEAGLVQWRIEPLLASLAAVLGERELSRLLAEGAQLDQQEIVDELR
jgi:predicted ATPase/class 3 adenylate cyclase